MRKRKANVTGKDAQISTMDHALDALTDLVTAP